MPKLILTETGKSGEKIVSLSDEIRIGRSPDCGVTLEGDGVSREHAQILSEYDQYYLTDLGSGNGTLLNGLQVKAGEKNILRNNDRITIEDYNLRFWRTDEFFEDSLKEEEEVTDADILEVKLLKKVLDAVDQETVPSLEVLNGSAEGKRVFLTDDTQEIIIGRDPSCDFPVNEYVISRNHAKIVKRWGGIALIDLESKNGTYVNNKRITEEVLHDGDRIAMGTIVFLYRNPQEINIKEISDGLEKKRTTEREEVQRTADIEHRKEKAEEKEEEAEGTPQTTEDILKDIPGGLKRSPANDYPLPILHTKRWSPMEIGMIGLGIAVLCFAVITLVNLLLE
ncbi:MAG: FHA domain-containing protein [Deltaproteobacteria bacterium]|nr:FHA domain-containing protein [Deltaproteobacteria bacterium]